MYKYLCKNYSNLVIDQHQILDYGYFYSKKYDFSKTKSILVILNNHKTIYDPDTQIYLDLIKQQSKFYGDIPFQILHSKVVIQYNLNMISNYVIYDLILNLPNYFNQYSLLDNQIINFMDNKTIIFSLNYCLCENYFVISIMNYTTIEIDFFKTEYVVIDTQSIKSNSLKYTDEFKSIISKTILDFEYLNEVFVSKIIVIQSANVGCKSYDQKNEINIFKSASNHLSKEIDLYFLSVYYPPITDNYQENIRLEKSNFLNVQDKFKSKTNRIYCDSNYVEIYIVKPHNPTNLESQLIKKLIDYILKKNLTIDNFYISGLLVYNKYKAIKFLNFYKSFKILNQQPVNSKHDDNDLTDLHSSEM
eukprot:Mrub_04206.p1 GENE.Mrub_04206~~Mrub_04206.p1  ORF type:complete len:404 (-),score=27.01 Mrub_04206:101-1183(-)